MSKPKPALPLSRAVVGLITSSCIALLSSCASIQGYPANPEKPSTSLQRLAPYFDGTEESAYEALPIGSSARTQKRNEIVFGRMRAYDIEFDEFRRELYGFSNSVSVGTDLTGLLLGGLTATVGGASTKAALGAASAGVLGANSAINKDLYFQKTIPALIAQMEANRAKQRLIIFKGLSVSDSKYPLLAAYEDLDAYRDAGSIPSAISSITQSAGNERQTAEHKIITFVRSAASIRQLPDKEKVQAKFKELTNAQILALAKEMEPLLATRPAKLRQLVHELDPQDARLSGNVAKAKEVLRAWIGEEDMTAANMKEWVAALADVTK